jgi:glycosyltransferase involved in cell wall biosynthesis
MGLRNVFFLPPLPKNQIHEALASSDACIGILKPIELYKTVYPNKVFDYMAAGKPVILAIDGVIRDVVETAGAGMAVPPGSVELLADAIRYYKKNPQVGKIHGRNGRHYLENHFDRYILAEKMLEIMLETKKVRH